MISSILLLLPFITSSVSIDIIYNGEIKLQSGIDKEEYVIKSPLPYSVKEELPSFWDWRKKGLLTTDLNQHLPQYCGSCWAHATSSTIADRIKIATNGQQRDVIPSIQYLLNCGTAGSCSGGDIHAVFRYIYLNPIPDETCQPYRAVDGNCTSPMDKCMTCSAKQGCKAVESYPTPVSISEYGRVLGDDNIQKEIMTRGPVACYINSNCLEDYTGGVNMYNQSSTGGPCHPYEFNHAIQLNGWGTDENGVDYWIGRNSWGTYWGEHGFFRVVRGGDYSPIGCYWAVPNIPDFI